MSKTTSSGDKPVVWLAGEVRSPPFSKEARIEAGLLLRKLQRGASLSMPHSRPMPSVGARCHELRIVDDVQSFRIVYRLEADAVVILDVFAKQTRRTPDEVIANCKRRLNAYERARGES
jgi:phage-related protein